MTFTAVVTSHDNPEGLRYILRNLAEQTRRPDEIIVLMSVEDSSYSGVNIDGHDATFIYQPNRNDWGHEKRATGLGLAQGDYVGFFNDDDMYDLSYIAMMMAEAEAGADVVYCDWSGISNCSFCLGSSTSGNYIVRTELAREVGYTDRHYEADGTFIDRIRESGAKVLKVERLLYWHNQQR